MENSQMDKSAVDVTADNAVTGTKKSSFEQFQALSEKLDSFGVELRGVHRVEPYERRHGVGIYYQMALLWLSGAGGLTSMSGFFLGPLLFGLSFKDSMSAGISGAFIGTGVAAYGSTLGSRSGLRQMVSARFTFGWWPAKFLALLNFITLLGWSVVNSVFGGQILAALSNNHVPIEVGITIITVVSLIVAIFGIRIVQYCESYIAIPVFIAFLLLYIVAGKDFTASNPSIGDSSTIIGNWLSYFASCFGITAAWIAIASDYYVEFPETTPSWKPMVLTWVSIFFPTAFVGTLGICVGTAAVSISSWNEAYENLGNGGLLQEAFSRWNGFGKFLLVLLYLSLITNNVLNTYSCALSTQVFGRIFTRIPRFILSFVSAVIYFVLAMAGRNKLSSILNNFLPMIGYWAVLYFVVLIEEQVLFRRHNIPGFNDSYDWRNWNSPELLPKGIAAALSFIGGIAGIVLGMCQAYYIGPVAKLIGDYGGDVALFLGAGIAAIVYPVARIVEIKYDGLK